MFRYYYVWYMCSYPSFSFLHAILNYYLRYFASEKVGHEGGMITLKKIGIKLIIPEGALPQGKNETIYVALMENDRDLPHLEGNLTLISPVIMCGPPGLKFEKPVMLIFPHCAAIERGISGFQSKTDIYIRLVHSIFLTLHVY